MARPKIADWERELLETPGTAHTEYFNSLLRKTVKGGVNYQKAVWGEFEKPIPGEEWKELAQVGFNNYVISNMGRVGHIQRRLYVKGSCVSGYRRVELKKSPTDYPYWYDRRCISHSFRVDHLVAKMFLEAPEYFKVLHMNGEKEDSTATNLSWYAIENHNRCYPTV